MWSRVVWAGHCLNCRYFRVPRAPINDFAEKVEFTKSFDSFTQKLCGEKKNRTGKGKNRISMATKTIAEPLISCPNACSRAIIMRKKKQITNRTWSIWYRLGYAQQTTEGSTNNSFPFEKCVAWHLLLLFRWSLMWENTRKMYLTSARPV